MRIKKRMILLLTLCFSMIWPMFTYASEESSDINEHEQRVIDYAIREGYQYKKKGVITYYRVTDSGVSALERKMRTVDWTADDADAAINSKPSKSELDEQLEKGYIYIESVYDPSSGENDNSESTMDTTQTSPTNPQNTTATTQASATTSHSTTGATTGSQSTITGGNGNNNQVSQQNNQNSNENSNTTVLDSNFSNISGQNTSVSQSSQGKALSIWNAVVSELNEKKEKSSSNSSENKKNDSAQEKGSNQEKSSDKESSTDSTKQSSSTTTTSLVENTLTQIEAENKAKSKFSSYKMLSKEDAAMQLICKTSSDEVKIIDKNGDTILSYTDSSVTSKGIEGNVVHVEWMIPFALILLFISIVCVYVEFKQHTRARENGVAPSQKTRKILSIIMRFILMICILIVLIVAGLFSGMFRSSSVTQALNNSSYYEYAYAEMAKNTVRILEENNIDSLTLADTLSYDDFVLVVKQQIEKQLSTPDGAINIQKTQENVNTQINEYYKNEEEKQIEKSGVEETKEEKKARKVQRKEKANVITNSIMTNYKKYADFYPSHFIRQVKRDLRAVFQVVLPVVALTILTNIIALYHLFRRRYKGIGYIGGAVAVSALIACAASGFVYIREPYTKLYLSPEYLYQFILTYLNSASKIFLVISVFLVVLAVVILVLNRIIFPKKRRI